MKKWIVIILVILLTMGAGLLVPVLMHPDGGSTVVIEPTGGTVETIEPAETNNAAGNDVKPSDGTSPGPIESTPGKEVKKTDDKGLKEQNNMIESPQTSVLGEHKNQTETNMEIAPEPTATMRENWVEAKIRKHRSEIDDEDLEDFRRIYSRVDNEFIQSLARDGYTDEEIEQLKSYLKSTLGGDYNRAKELFYNYSYLMNED